MIENVQNLKVCIYFLKGNCKAANCKFRHDTENILCRRNCKQKSCPFKHFVEIKEPSNKVERLKPPPKVVFLQNEPIGIGLVKNFPTRITSNNTQSTSTAILNPKEKQNDRFSQLYDLACRDLLPYSLPIPSLKATLKLHQLQGLNWLLEKEAQYHGGILADEMGLGKTLLMIALVNISNRGINLVVCPVSLIKPWVAEIKLWTDNTVIEYSAKLTNETLMQYRFVIISYEMLSSTHSKRPLFYGINFERVMLDEADKIRNHKTKMAAACYALTSKYKWAITGTPINNSALDLYSLVRFLRIKPMMDLDYFQRHLGMESTAKIINLQALLRKILLRRTKEVVVDLPPIRFEKRELEMSAFERMIYDLVVIKASNSRVLRLKQCCNDVHSIDGVFDKGEVDRLWNEFSPKHSEDGISKLFGNMKIVGDLDEDALLKGFANLKLEHPNLNSSKPKPKYKLVKKNQMKSPMNTLSVYTSTKIMELLKICQEKSSKGEKIIIFSQFVRMLTRISMFFSAKAISFTLLTGEMSQSARASALLHFTNTATLLASLKCAAVGLNLTMATTVIMFDQWYNPALEDQAFARVYRIGQTRPVTVIRLIMKNTVERYIMEINDRKRRGIELAVGADCNDDDAIVEGYVQKYKESLNDN